MGLDSIRCIVVGLDIEGRAAAALRSAAALAEATSAQLIAAHAVAVPVLVGDELSLEGLLDLREDLVAAARRDLEQHYGSLLPEGARLQSFTGPPERSLIETCEQGPADLLFLGPHRKHGLFDFGNVARAMLAKAPCPVWVQPGEYRPVKRILVPIDLSDESPEILRQAAALAAACQASVHVLYCFSPPDVLRVAAAGAGARHQPLVRRVLEVERERFDTLVSEVTWPAGQTGEVLEGPPQESILAEQAEHDLIVMGTHGRTGLSRYLLGNTAYGVLKSATIPVVAIKPAG